MGDQVCYWVERASTLTGPVGIGYFCRAMFWICNTICILAPISLTVLVVSPGFANGPVASRKTKDVNYFLLTNGEVVVGQVQIVQNQFEIFTAEGISWRVPQREVLFRGRRLADVYAFRRKSLRPSEIAEQLELAEWCLVQSLFFESAVHILQTRQLGLNDQRIDSLEARLRMAATKPATVRSQVAVARPPELLHTACVRVPEREKRRKNDRFVKLSLPVSDPFDPEVFNAQYSPRHAIQEP